MLAFLQWHLPGRSSISYTSFVLRWEVAYPKDELIFPQSVISICQLRQTFSSLYTWSCRSIAISTRVEVGASTVSSCSWHDQQETVDNNSRSNLISFFIPQISAPPFPKTGKLKILIQNLLHSNTTGGVGNRRSLHPYCSGFRDADRGQIPKYPIGEPAFCGSQCLCE